MLPLLGAPPAACATRHGTRRTFFNTPLLVRGLPLLALERLPVEAEAKASTCTLTIGEGRAVRGCYLLASMHPGLALHIVSLGTPFYEAALRLREEVLLRPFGISLEAARDDDETATHFGLFSGEGGAGGAICVATLLLVPRAHEGVQMRQVAVDPNQRRRGLGRALVAGAESWARESRFEVLFAHARETALPFYRALAYAEVGVPFEQVGLPHRRVEKLLSGGKHLR